MITLDASVAVKWFKEGEEYGGEALRLLESIKDMEVTCASNEWVVLEIIRALVKAGYPKEKIESAHEALTEFFNVGLIKKIRVSEVLNNSKDLEISLGLYAADAVHLATAMHTASEILVTEDKHLLSDKVKAYSKKHDLEVLTLKDYF